MEYKFFTEEEANYISEMCKGTNTIRKNRFEEEFYNLHYDELVKGRRGEEWIKDAEKKKDLTDNQFLIIKVNALNYGIGCLNYFNDNDIDYRKDILKDIAGNFYKEDENYIKLLSYILFSKSSQRIDNIDTLDLFIDELTGILNYKDLRKCYIENYEFRKGVELKEKGEKGEKMEYHKLFVDLSSEEWGEIFGIFMKLTSTTYFGESISVKKKKIKEYCDEKDYDFLTALREIYFYIRGKYSFRWYNTETKERGRDYYDKKKLRVYEKCFHEIIIYIETSDFERSMVEKEEQDIYHTMINILKERKENPDKYINNILQKVKLKADYLSSFEKEFYVEANSIKKEVVEIAKARKTQESASNSGLCVGSYDEKQTKQLYDECNNVVFKYCKIEDFVNSLNNPDECNLEVINKNLLYVLYTYFFNFFEEEAYTKIELLNEKFNITRADYQKHKYPNKNPSEKQKEFDKNLALI